MESKVDLVIGNPPWIVLRTIENQSYQEFIKKEIKRYELSKGLEPHYFTQIEMATLFFRKSADLYLQTNGIISFLMPISVLSSSGHHKPFQKFENPYVKLLIILNFEKISDIFRIF